MAQKEIALIVGAGSGLSRSLAVKFANEGMAVALAARNPDKLADLANETGARAYACDAAQSDQVAALFDQVETDLGTPTVVVYNPGGRLAGPVTDIDPEGVKDVILVGCYGGFLVGQQAAKQMKANGGGSILFTGASASVKGYANSSSFAMAKFGLRGLAQSMARELAPQNIHVAHFVIDGGISHPNGPTNKSPDSDEWMNPDAIAETYFNIHRQHRSAWTWEVELRPWVENF
jgi:NAD(P)-dependent dehydrogenase (short-subunit alcohol dehydrogenase family)